MDRDFKYEESVVDRLVEEAANVIDGRPRYRTALCHQCKHLFSKLAWTCSAYPRGIPLPILHSEVDHRRSYEGDNGIQFEMINLAEEDYLPPPNKR